MAIPGHENFDFAQTLKQSFDPTLDRLRVDALITDGVDALVVNPDGSINVDVTLVPGSEVQITDGTDTLEINNDGSINVNVVSASSSGIYQSLYNEVTSVPSATPTIVQTYTVPPVTSAFLQKIDVSGTNIAMYEILINSVVQNKARTYFGNSLDDKFDFTSSSEDGYPLLTGDIVEVQVTHNRPFVGDFNARIQAVEVL